jgi:hypothetical protein
MRVSENGCGLLVCREVMRAGEATEASDIDTVVILDELSASDIQSNNNMLDALPIENWFAVSCLGKMRF